MNDLTIINTSTNTGSASASAPAQPESVDPDAVDRDTVEGDTSGSAGDIDIALLEQTLEYIRPAIQMDGGDIILLGTEAGVVNLQMVGACGGCPMSMMTLKAGIERILTDRVPGVVEVNATA